MEIDSLSVAEALRFGSVIAISMVHIFTAACSFYMERRTERPPMFAVLFVVLAWCTLTLGSGTSGLGRYFPVLLVGAPILSGYLGPVLFIYTKQLVSPHDRVSLKWIFCGVFGTIHSFLALILPDGLDPAIQSILHKNPYIHPILSPLMFVHSIQLISFAILSTFLITRCYIQKNNPDLRRTQFWLMTICWTCLVIVVFTNILPTFRIIITEIQPAFITLPIAIVGGLSIKAIGEESNKDQISRIKQRDVRMDSLGRMARGLAHDLNNVLATVMGHAEIVKLKLPINHDTHSHLDQIVSGTHRAAGMIDRMLAYSGKRDMLDEVIDPTPHLEAVFESVATLQPSIVTMRLDSAIDLPHVRIDSLDLEGAIQNLLQNSLNALEGGKGQIVLKAAFERTTKLPSDFIGNDLTNKPALRIEVEDTGHGMSFEEASRALEPFFSTSANGKGLGLVNVFSSVDGAGGALWFHSEQHVGTRFVLWFPAIDDVKVERDSIEVQSLNTLHVLLVEDDIEVAKVLVEIVQSLGVTVECYQDSEQVMSLIQNQKIGRFDIAILDVRLGRIDGVEIGHHLLFEQIVDSLLFISGDEPGQRIQQFPAEKVLFLRKPVGIEQVNSSLQRLQKQSSSI